MSFHYVDSDYAGGHLTYSRAKSNEGSTWPANGGFARTKLGV